MPLPDGDDVKRPSVGQFNIRKSNRLNGSDALACKESFEGLLKSKGASDDLEVLTYAFGFFLYAIAYNSSSVNAAENVDEAMFDATMGNAKISLTCKDVMSFMRNSPFLSRFKVNPLRAFCRSYPKEYLDFCRTTQGLPTLPNANKVGLPDRYSYLAADFLDTSHGLSDAEQCSMMLAKEYALRDSSATSRVITNLHQLGNSTI